MLNFFDLIVDITCIGNKRIVTITQRYAMLKEPGSCGCTRLGGL